MAESWFDTYAELELPSLTRRTLRAPTGGAASNARAKPAEEVPEVPGFALRRRLGAGGQGTVYLATREASGEEVALKWIEREDLRAVAALKEEFRSLAEITHPNVVRLHELVVTDAYGYLTMEYVPGEALLRSLRPNEEHRIRLAFAQLALAVAAVHDHGMSHGDISNRNVLLTREGRVVLLDFGLVRRARDQEGTERLVRGTPGYMAPEQLLGHPASPASDWYGFGTLLFRAVTGRLPFAREEDLDLPAKLADDAPTCASVRPGVPPDLTRLCAQLLARDPDRRPRGDEILARLGAATATPRRARGELAGRDEELAVLEEAYRIVARRGSVVLRVVGEAGMGKSALLRHFIAGLGGAATVLQSRCDDRAQVAFRAVDELFDELARRRVTAGGDDDVGALAQLFPSLAPHAEGRVHATGEVLDRAQAELRALLAPLTPVVLWIDDVQWSDLDSVPLVLGLIRQPLPGLLLVLSCRTADGEPLANPLLAAVDSLPRDVPVDTIVVGPLGLDGARAILGGGVSLDEAAQIHAHCGGSPLHLTELAQHAVLQAFLGGDSDGAPIPYAQQVLGRAAHLASEQRQILEWVALGGGPLPARVIPEEAHEALQTLEELGRVTRERDRLSLPHDRDRELVSDALPSTAKRHRHRELAARYEAVAPEQHEALAYHFECAGDGHRAAHHQVQAARRARRTYAFDRAAELLARACDNLGRFDPVAATALEPRLAECLARAGRLTEAWKLFDECAARSEGTARAEHVRQRVEHQLTSGDYAGALAPLRELLRGFDLPPLASQSEAFAVTARELARALTALALRGRRPAQERGPQEQERLLACLTALRGFTTYDTFRGAAYTFVYLRLALEGAAPSHLALAAAYGSVMASVAGTPALEPLRRHLMDLARREAAASGEPDLVAAVEMAREEQRIFAGEWGAAEAIRGVLPAVRRRGRYGAERDTAEQIRMIGLERRGDLLRLEREAHQRYVEGRERAVPAAVGKNAGWLAFCALGRDDVSGAQAYVRTSVAALPDHAFLFAHWLAWRAACWCHLYRGGGPEALGRFLADWSAVKGSGLLQLEIVRLPTLVLRAAVLRAAGRPLPRDLVRAGRALRADPRPHRRGAGHLLGEGDLTAAEEAFEAAGMHLAALSCRWIRTPPRDRDHLHHEFRRRGVHRPERWPRVYGLGEEA